MKMTYQPHQLIDNYQRQSRHEIHQSYKGLINRSRIISDQRLAI